MKVAELRGDLQRGGERSPRLTVDWGGLPTEAQPLPVATYVAPGRYGWKKTLAVPGPCLRTVRPLLPCSCTQATIWNVID